MKKTFLVSLILLLSIMSQAQNAKTPITSSSQKERVGIKSEEFSAPLSGIIEPKSVDLAWMPILDHVAVKHKKENNVVEEIKNQKLLIKLLDNSRYSPTEDVSLNTAIMPIVSRNFRGNRNNGSSPLDNSIAISNGGKIISVANTTIEFYQPNGTRTYTNSIEGFFNDPGIIDVCDPVVHYDSGSDRFIFFAQECSGSSGNTYLLICFSQTNDPNGSWWRYKLDGDPADLNTWFDYPKIAVSNNELYITGNSFTNSGDFHDVLLYQIDKQDGYAGSNLSWQYWNNIPDAFTLLPVSYGQQGNYGPGVYLVSTESAGSSTIGLYDLTNDMSAADETLLYYPVSTDAYEPAANGFQFGTDTGLDNGDCRSLSGFYLDGVIHFVFHSDYADTYNGINYNRLDVSGLSNESSRFGKTGYEYSYPSVASFSNSENDHSVMIGFGRTGEDIYPEIRVVACDHDWNWSSSVLVKEGAGFSDYTASAGEAERWGDYTGITRKHNDNASTVWISGSYGTSSNDWETWIGEITGITVSAVDETNMIDSHLKVYPNPASASFTTSFNIDRDDDIGIDIYDQMGVHIKNLYAGIAHAGTNNFTFDSDPLTAGTYFISITSNHQILKNEKIIIAD